MHRLVGLLMTVIATLGAAWLSGGFAAFLDAPALILVATLTAGAWLIAARPSEALDAAWAVAAGPGDADPARRLRRVRVLAAGHQAAWGAGLVSSLLGLIAMLADLSDPASIGAAMAAALLPVLYAAALAELVLGPAGWTLAMQLEVEPPPGDPEGGAPAPPAVPWRGVSVVLLVLVLFLVSTLSFAGSGAAG